jgi:hypothetical protein
VLEFIIQCRDWGERKVARAVPERGDPWGRLAPLRGTKFEAGIPVVSARAYQDATLGWFTPLRREVGRDPYDRLRAYRKLRCLREAEGCVMFRERVCVPQKGLVECFEAEGEMSEKTREAISYVLNKWANNYYVIVVEEEEEK